MNNFKKYAAYYDLLYKSKNYKNEAIYVDKLLNIHSDKTPSDILDFGCGTGRHAVALNKLGYKVDGVDLSEEMIDQAKNNFSHLPDLNFYFGDIKSWRNSSKKKYDAIISLFHVMSYQVNNEDVEAVFNSANENLNEDGLFVFDIWYGPGVLLELPSTRTKNVKNDQFEILRISQPSLRLDKNIVDVKFTLFMIDSSQNIKFRVVESHSMRYFFLPELLFISNKYGFELKDKYVSNSMEKDLKGAWHIHCVFKKIK